MNVNGVATATVIANIVSSSILFIKLTKTEKWVHLDLHKLSIDRACLLKILRIGLPAGIQSAVFIQPGLHNIRGTELWRKADPAMQKSSAVMCSRRSGNNCCSCHPDPLQRKIPALPV